MSQATAVRYSKPILDSLSVFMPAYNEEGNIAAVVLEAVKIVSRLVPDYEIIVVNDGSTDQTATIVQTLSKANPRIRLVSHARNRGYGAAVKTGLAACTKNWIFFTDSDGQFHFDELPRFLALHSRGDLIMGYRRKRMDPFHRIFLAQVLLKIWNFMLFGLTVRDVDCAYKLFPARLRDALTLKTASAITVTEFVVKAKTAGFKIYQTPVTHYPRKFGTQTGGHFQVILKAATDSFRLFRDLRRR